MTYKEFTDILKKQVALLPYSRQLDFALTVCKTLFIDYQRFHEVENWGNPSLLMEAINFCEQAKEILSSKTEIETWISKIEAITPDTEDFGDELGSCALNACVVVLHTLQLLLTKDTSEIFWIGIAVYDTVDAKVQMDQQLSEEQISEHPLVQETIQFVLERTRL